MTPGIRLVSDIEKITCSMKGRRRLSAAAEHADDTRAYHFGRTALYTESETNEGQRLSMQANLRATIYDAITILPRQRVHLAFAIIGKLQISLSDDNKRRVSIFQSDETFASRRQCAFSARSFVSTSILKDQSPPV
ncbi:uncharacterized protein LOC122537095 [Frieseomelitta varia]|uniref:uncharacterized protein LOC122537095 n=1 Tax=Frieseomelitta varia TaxID=561572 RepID=UPI001CB68F07|nr:uncharacterized protein LOC122537095 [Frieseomelitta varia]